MFSVVSKSDLGMWLAVGAALATFYIATMEHPLFHIMPQDDNMDDHSNMP